MKSDEVIKSYLEEGKAWYASCYLGLKFDVLRCLMSFLLIFLTLIPVMKIVDFSSSIVIMPFPMFVEEDLDEVRHIKSLFDPDKAIDESVAAYMVERYVLLREKYAPSILEEKSWSNLLINLDGLSSYKTFDEYLDYMLPNKNPHSPILKYRFNTFVQAEVESVRMTKYSTKKPIAAVVDFFTTECKEKYEKCKIEHWTANLDFEMSDINKLHLTGNGSKPDFNFRVLKYSKLQK